MCRICRRSYGGRSRRRGRRGFGVLLGVERRRRRVRRSWSLVGASLVGLRA